jgi:hypothetical protein
MKQKMLNLILTLAVVFLFVQAAQSQVQFQVNITVAAGTSSQILKIGVSGDGPGGTIQDNTIGADTDPSFGIYQELLAPPAPPAPFDFDTRIVTIPGRVSTFPTGLGGGVFGDYRGFFSSSQVDSFKITIAGDFTDNGPTTISWPNNLNLYGTTWTIKPQTGSDWPTTNMLTSTSLDIPAGLQKNIIIIKTGAFAPTPGPTFVLNNASLNFGNVAVGGSSTQSVTVTNTGSSNPLSITGVTPIAGYTVNPNPPGTYPISVAAGASRNFDIVFSPTAPGTAAGNIAFAHNAPGTPTNLAVTGIGVSQGGTLQFASTTRTRFDNSTNYLDSLQLVNYVGQPLKALQLRFITNGLLIVRSVSRGLDIPSPQFSFSSVIARGPAELDGSSHDTIKIVIYGTGSNTLPGGSAPGSNYLSLVRFGYDVVNISDPDQQSAPVYLTAVLGSLVNGTDAGVTAGPQQVVTVNNRTQLGDNNNDDRVDILDLLRVVDHILNRITLTGDDFTRADIAPWTTGNPGPAPDGVVNVQDLAVLQNVILTGQYPSGDPVARPIVLPAIVAGNGLNKLNPGVDAKVTFHLTATGIAVRLENAVPVKGMQIEFGNVPFVPANLSIATSLGSGFSKLVSQTLRVLLYDEAVTILPAGDRIVANIPFSLVNPADVTLENLVVAGADNRQLRRVESELALTAAEELPTDYALLQNYPNPFNPTTNIKFSVPQTSDVRVSIYNLLGQEVRTLFAGQMDRGTRVVEWNGLDNNGRPLSSGTYVYRMTAGSFVESHKMLLLK